MVGWKDIEKYLHLPTIEKFTEGRLYQSLAKSAFENVDVDQSGFLDSKELHIAILLLYDKVNACLPCHIDPPDRQQIYQLMIKYDVDANGRLDYGEYNKLAKVCFFRRTDWKDSFLVKIAFAVFMKMVVYPYTGISAKNFIANSMGVGFVGNVPDPIVAAAFETIFLTTNAMR